MSFTATVTPGASVPDGVPVTNAMLRALGVPGVAVTGPAVTSDLADGAVTVPKTSFDASGTGLTFPTGAAAALRTAGRLAVSDAVVAAGAVIDPHAFGAIGDGTSHPVSEWIGTGLRYANLAALQVDYPWVQSANDECDYAALQAALQRAWQIIASKYGSTGQNLLDSMYTNAATVAIRAGYYKVNRTLVIPPRCRVVGAGRQNTTVIYTGNLDAKWTFFNTTGFYRLPDSGLYAAFFWRNNCAPGETYITQHGGVALVHSSMNMVLPSDRAVYNYSGEFSGIAVASAKDECAALILVGLGNDSQEIRNNHFNGYGSNGPNGKFYGVVNVDSAPCQMLNTLFEGNIFEACQVGLVLYEGVSVSVTNNKFWDSQRAVVSSGLWLCNVSGNELKNELMFTNSCTVTGWTMPVVGGTVTLTTFYAYAFPHCLPTGWRAAVATTGGVFVGVFEVMGSTEYSVTLKNLGLIENQSPGYTVGASTSLIVDQVIGFEAKSSGTRIANNHFMRFRQGVRVFGNAVVAANVFMAPRAATAQYGWAVEVQNMNGCVNVSSPWGNTYYYGRDNEGNLVAGNTITSCQNYVPYSAAPPVTESVGYPDMASYRPFWFHGNMASEWGGGSVTDYDSEVVRGEAFGNVCRGLRGANTSRGMPGDIRQLYQFTIPTPASYPKAGKRGMILPDELRSVVDVAVTGANTYELKTHPNDFEVAGTVQLTFDATAGDKTIYLPDPAGFGDRRFWLRVDRAAIGAAKVTLAVGTVGTPISNALVNPSTSQVVSSWDFWTASAARLVGVIELYCDGGLWYPQL